jgi:rhamnulokinase
LYAAKLEGAAGIQTPGAQLLFMPDLLSFWLSGVRKNELTIASTSQFYNPATKTWATELFETLGLPASLLGEIVPPGARLGPLLDELADTSGLEAVPVFATAGHDTAAAVAAAPATGDQPWCYISSGTWSLMGLELPEPLIHPASSKPTSPTKSAPPDASASSKTSPASGLSRNAAARGCSKPANTATFN